MAFAVTLEIQTQGAGEDVPGCQGDYDFFSFPGGDRVLFIADLDYFICQQLLVFFRGQHELDLFFPIGSGGKVMGQVVAKSDLNGRSVWPCFYGPGGDRDPAWEVDHLF